MDLTSRRSLLGYLVTAVVLTFTIITFWPFMEWTEFVHYKPPSFDNFTLPEENTSSPHRANFLPENDFTKLIDLDNFEFLMNHSCNGSGPLLLTLVHSHPSNDELRSTIRSTWGSVVGSNFKLFFFFGIPRTEKEQSVLMAENERHGDIVQGNFMDTYRNLTYKHVMALKWAVYFCPNAKYVVKCDDDVFINTPGLINYINDRLSPYEDRKLIFCQVFEKNPVYRAGSVWTVSYDEYKDEFYPPFCAGNFIIYGPDVVFDLYENVQSSPFFWIDDVHITGTMALKANITHHSFQEYILNSRSEIPNLAKNHSYLIGPINLSPMQIYLLWKTVDYSESESLTTIPITKNPER